MEGGRLRGAKKVKRKRPVVVYQGKKPSAVILDIDDYAKLLAVAEDLDDLRFLAKLRKRPGDVAALETYLSRRNVR